MNVHTMEQTASSFREELVRGVHRFRTEIFPKNREKYEIAAREPQRPHTLVITCADSRVDPEMVTQSGPGKIFVTRNIGNLVPAYGEMVGGVSAVIEYAVVALEVSQVVVCGHSDCGAMKGLLARHQLTEMPTVNSWLRNAEAALSIVNARHPNGHDHDTLSDLIQENVLLQLNHLRTHPSVAGRVAQGKLELYGWIYDIGAGTVNEYNPGTHSFSPLQ